MPPGHRLLQWLYQKNLPHGHDNHSDNSVFQVGWFFDLDAFEQLFFILADEQLSSFEYLFKKEFQGWSFCSTRDCQLTNIVHS